MPFKLIGPLNGLTMMESNREPYGFDSRCRFCPTCGSVLNKWDEHWDLEVKPKGGPPMSITRDSFYVASPSFRRRYDEAGFKGLTFRPLSCGYFEIRAERCLDMQATFITEAERDQHFKDWMDNFEAFGSPSAFCPVEPLCQECGQWSYMLATGMSVIAPGQKPPEDLEICATSCLACGQRIEGFDLIIGDGVRNALRSPKMSAVSVFERVLVADDPPPSGLPTLPYGVPGIVPRGAHTRVGAGPGPERKC